MKRKIFVSLILSFLLLFGACSLNGFGNLYISDEKRGRERFETLLEALDSKDEKKLKEMFSENAITDDEAFRKNTELLFEYYQGTSVSYTSWGGPGVFESIDEGKRKKVIDLSCDVVTSDREYRICIFDVFIDSFDSGNVGMWSLYIIKTEDDTDLQMSYGGDGKKTPGINIGIKNIYERDW